MSREILLDEFFVEGGEYNDGATVWTNLGAVYDPVADTWTAVTPPANWTQIGDAQSVVLANGGDVRDYYGEFRVPGPGLPIVAVPTTGGTGAEVTSIAMRPMPMSELASLLTVDPPNLTPVVDDLERAGLVERQPHPTDRRVKLVVATPEGTALAQTADDILARPPARFSALPAEDLASLVRILGLLQPDPTPDY